MTINVLQNLHQKTYRLETIVIEQRNPFYSTQKSYVREVEVYYYGKVKDQHDFQVLVTHFDFSEGGTMDSFLKKVSYLFDEIECKVDDDGNITTVGNLLFLRLRWAKIRTNLSETHKGDAVDRYFSQISDLLEDETKLIDFLGSYKMFGLLFNGLLNSFDTKMKRESSEGFIEIMNPVKDGNILTLKISAENLEESNIEQFRGLFVWKEDRYEEGFIEIKKQNSHLKHSLLWIG
ncbi:hypothetical protein [Chryseobacterium sp. Marseille-Q3244]|uniref:hypothetical protein n=1 Tax=Chryseobacterium sp. Marseille-Q3244 TaxID=2758092 RepID=UPI002023EE75|nr:hypothetical protein [Chryseobacterium sp. Marseille-Q3244]